MRCIDIVCLLLAFGRLSCGFRFNCMQAQVTEYEKNVLVGFSISIFSLSYVTRVCLYLWQFNAKLFGYLVSNKPPFFVIVKRTGLKPRTSREKSSLFSWHRKICRFFSCSALHNSKIRPYDEEPQILRTLVRR